MGRKLTFKDSEGNEIVTEIEKLKREELYGWSEIEAFDENGNKCELVSIADDGQTLFSSGGYVFANQNSEGQFVESQNLTAVDISGKPLKTYEPSFKTGIELTNTATAEEFLSYQVKSVYLLDIEPFPIKIQEALHAREIFSFDFSYTAGTNVDKGFLFTNEESELFLILTIPSEITYLTFSDSVTLDEMDQDGEDLLDFGSL